jgi:hypothetical protein
VTVGILIVETFIATVNVASEPTSEKIMLGAEMSHNLSVSKASEEACVSVAFYGWNFHRNLAYGTNMSLE